MNLFIRIVIGSAVGLSDPAHAVIGSVIQHGDGERVAHPRQLQLVLSGDARLAIEHHLALPGDTQPWRRAGHGSFSVKLLSNSPLPGAELTIFSPRLNSSPDGA
ncbi:hypothetical protein ACU4GD_18935 [Cupriavidus basilensis]